MRNSTLKLIRSSIYYLFLLLLLSACGSKNTSKTTSANTNKEPETPTEVSDLARDEPKESQVAASPEEDSHAPSKVEDQPTVELVEPKVMYSMEAPSDASENEKKDFKVVLSVDSTMYLGQSGMMEVWIGEEDVDVSFSKGMTQDEKIMSSSIGKFAKITPLAPDFEITAHATNICYKIDPNGSEVRFTLKPKDEGTYKVSADIELFETEDCTGVSVPKTAKSLSVFVGVDMKKEISKKVHELESVVWDKFKIFWVALMTLIFSAAIYVIRKYIKNKTGYEEGPPTS